MQTDTQLIPASPSTALAVVGHELTRHDGAAWDAVRDDGRKMPGLHLEEVRDQLKHRLALLSPSDVERSTAQALVRVSRTPAVKMLQRRDGVNGTSTAAVVTRHAMRQLCSFVLPSRGLGFLDRLVSTDGTETFGEGGRIATMALAHLGQQRTDPLLWRMVRQGTGWRCRAVLSQTYKLYDYHELIDDMLTGLNGDAGLWRVIQSYIGDDVMRLRLVGGTEERLEAWADGRVNPWGQLPEKGGEVYPIVEVSNSETGQGAVYVRGKTFRPVCLNGMGSWDTRSVHRWNHSGKTSQRIRDGVRQAMQEAAVHGAGLADAYRDALRTTVDDAFAWFDAAWGDDLTNTQQDAVKDAIYNEPTTSGEGRMLSSVVDAVTWVAHEQADLHAEERLERLAGSILRRGLDESQNYDGRLYAPRATA
jgi:hypothetical protein